MSLPPPTLTCLFHSDATVTSFLQSSAGRAFAGDLLVECALTQALSYVLNLETPQNYPGIAGVLGGVDVGTLAHPSDLLPAPIILAAGTPGSPIAVRTALDHLRRPDERLKAITLLVPVADARALGAALAVADRFAIAWNAAAFPHEELVDFARWIANEGLLHRGTFLGFHPYVTEPVEAAHAQKISAILAQAAARTPSFRTAIDVTAS